MEQKTENKLTYNQALVFNEIRQALGFDAEIDVNSLYGGRNNQDNAKRRTVTTLVEKGYLELSRPPYVNFVRLAEDRRQSLWFKLGDKVRERDTGSIGVITQIIPDGRHWVEIGDAGFYFYADEIQLITSAAINKPEPATHYVDAAQMLSLKERTAPILQEANTKLLEQIHNLEAQLKTEKTISTAAITDLDAAMVENELLKEWAHLVQSARDVLRNQLAAMREQRDWADEAARLNYEAWQKAEATIKALRQELQGRYGFNETVY